MLLIWKRNKRKSLCFCFDREFTISLKEGALKRQCRAVSLSYYNDVTVMKKVQIRPMTSQCLSLKNLVPCLVITQVFSCFLIFFDVWLEEDEIRSNFAIDVTPATTEDSNPHEATLNRRRSCLKIMVWLDPLENASMWFPAKLRILPLVLGPSPRPRTADFRR